MTGIAQQGPHLVLRSTPLHGKDNLMEVTGAQETTKDIKHSHDHSSDLRKDRLSKPVFLGVLLALWIKYAE